MGEGHRLDTKTPPGRDGSDRSSCRKEGCVLKPAGFIIQELNLTDMWSKCEPKVALITFLACTSASFNTCTC